MKRTLLVQILKEHRQHIQNCKSVLAIMMRYQITLAELTLKLCYSLLLRKKIVFDNISTIYIKARKEKRSL